MPADAGIAFVIIQHLAPDHPTALPQLLGRHTAMPVEEAQDKTQVVPNRVYVIPPNATLTIEKGMLGVRTPAEARGSRTPIDDRRDTIVAPTRLLRPLRCLRFVARLTVATETSLRSARRRSRG